MRETPLTRICPLDVSHSVHLQVTLWHNISRVALRSDLRFWLRGSDGDDAAAASRGLALPEWCALPDGAHSLLHGMKGSVGVSHALPLRPLFRRLPVPVSSAEGRGHCSDNIHRSQKLDGLV